MDLGSCAVCRILSDVEGSCTASVRVFNFLMLPCAVVRCFGWGGTGNQVQPQLKLGTVFRFLFVSL